MARFLRMPGVSADSDAAALELWTVETGAAVKAGDVIASVETEKAVVDIEVDEDAVVHALVVDAGSMVPVGDPIAVLLEPGEGAAAGDALVAQLGGAPAEPAAAPEPAAPSAPEQPAPVPGELVTAEAAAAPPASVAPEAGPASDTGAAGGRIVASPLARRIARERGVELSGITGTGPRGRIVRADVEAAAAQPAAPAPAPEKAASVASEPVSVAPVVVEGGTAEPHSRLRRAIARRLQESKRNAPHFYLTRHIRVDDLLALRATINADSPVRVSVNDLFVKAAGRALVDVPEMNVVWTEDAVIGFDTADISVAVASERGLVTPTIRGIETLSLATLSARIKDAVTRANAGRLQQAELEGGSLSITNLGMFGIDEFAAIINPPQAAILAIGAATRRPFVAEDGELIAASVVTVTLSVDHRPVDGVIAARWLDRFAGLIASPMQLLL